MIEFIAFFIAIILAEAIGFWLGLRSQKKKVKRDIKGIEKVISGPGEKLIELPESGIIKALTPEQMEAERKKKLEKEMYG